MKTLQWLALGVLPLSYASSACIDPHELDPGWSKAVAANEYSWGTGRSGEAAGAECSSATVEKLGVRFTRLCASDRLDGGWIASIPMPCSPGAHGTMACPIATPILHEPESEGASTPREVMLIDASTAHRMCAMRFGGRLPSQVELAELRARSDSAVVMAHGALDGRIEFNELPEWIGEGKCSHPTLPETNCRFELRPRTDFARTLPWRNMLSCELERVPGAVSADVALGRSCKVEGGKCLVERRWGKAAGRDVWRAACSAVRLEGDYPKVDADVAMVRCVVPIDAFPEAR
jgi:hypothetical protein